MAISARTSGPPRALGRPSTVPAAERAIETGSPDGLIEVLGALLEEAIRHKLACVMQLAEQAPVGVAEARQHVEQMLGLQVWSHTVFQAVTGSAHEHGNG